MALLFVVTWIILLILALRMMARGWSAASDLSSGNYVESSKTVTKIPHPEMMDVKPGEELMGVTFKSKEVTECDLDEYRALQARIEELKLELGGEDEEEDEDDDGDVVISRS